MIHHVYFSLLTYTLTVIFTGIDLLSVMCCNAQDQQPSVAISTEGKAPSRARSVISPKAYLEMYVKAYRVALDIMKSAEDELITRPQNWMPAAQLCQRAIDYVPRLKEAPPKSNSVDPSKLNIHRALKDFCAPIMEHALSKIDRRGCKAYWMLRRAFDYFERRDLEYWRPRLKRLRGCK